MCKSYLGNKNLQSACGLLHVLKCIYFTPQVMVAALKFFTGSDSEEDKKDDDSDSEVWQLLPPADFHLSGFVLCKYLNIELCRMKSHQRM